MRSAPNSAVRKFAGVGAVSFAVKIAALGLFLVLVVKLFGGF